MSDQSAFDKSVQSFIDGVKAELNEYYRAKSPAEKKYIDEGFENISRELDISEAHKRTAWILFLAGYRRQKDSK